MDIFFDRRCENTNPAYVFLEGRAHTRTTRPPRRRKQTAQRQGGRGGERGRRKTSGPTPSTQDDTTARRKRTARPAQRPPRGRGTHTKARPPRSCRCGVDIGPPGEPGFGPEASLRPREKRYGGCDGSIVNNGSGVPSPDINIANNMPGEGSCGDFIVNNMSKSVSNKVNSLG